MCYAKRNKQERRQIELRYLTEQQSRNLKALLVQSGLTLSGAAEKMGILRQSLSNRLKGKIDFSRTEMEAFAEIVGESPAKIFFAA
ncbi:MAG: helix-turn-helix domain-containing protein [Clostridium sp.]|nr:helix-turn-helix domain-containing protein [Clostridium sp.]